jgi:hypothetical protein
LLGQIAPGTAGGGTLGNHRLEKRDLDGAVLAHHHPADAED